MGGSKESVSVSNSPPEMPKVTFTASNGAEPLLRIRTTGCSHTGLNLDFNLSSLGAKMSMISTSCVMLGLP